MGPRRCGWWGPAALAFLWGAAAAKAQEDPVHLFSEVLFCQEDYPFSGLSQTLDDEQLFWFDFLGDAWHPHLPDFQPEVQNRTSKEQIEQQNSICQQVLDILTNFSDTYVMMPEAKGIPQVEIFTLRPLQLGTPNTLICSVTNIFPPSANLTWAHHDQAVTQGVSTPQIYPVQVLDFKLFSYLEVTPQEGDIYSCTVRSPRDKFSTVAFWVPKDPIASELLENILCGVAFGLGILFIITGVVLTLMARAASKTE
ncbi:class II histocompatibility antigen, M alpha chain [Rhineura floridana]|uniref:class II histocompatibility antigen, M alpha chain n=1 Tax=Rhineura floridana TaxID=261503 RepID=UPI002AC7E869|nr:class II histocompatibility antigen, M alpha chain [Rhineura floridana]